jgi:hypothetical protein
MMIGTVIYTLMGSVTKRTEIKKGGKTYMSKCDVKQNALCKSLGPEYKIMYIDLERCIYRDFGNGFDAEISGTHTTSNRKTATIYLWYVPEKITVKRVSGVKQSEIGKVVDELYQFSQELLCKGITSRDELWAIRRSASL